MNILIIYDHNQNDSYCLFSAINKCLSKNPNFCIYLKNLDQSVITKNSLWYKSLVRIHKDRIRVFNKKRDLEISIVCSMSEKTPSFFLQDQNPGFVGIFNKNKRIITYDYISPFLLMKNCPNKLNRENIYNLMINGSVSKCLQKSDKGTLSKDSHNNEIIFQTTNNNIAKVKINKDDLKNTITNPNTELIIGNSKYICRQYKELIFYSLAKNVNLYEEIIHLSIMFGIHNVDYVIPDAEANQSDLNYFQECLEYGFESLEFAITFIKQGDKNKVIDSLNLFNKSMNRFKVFEPVREFFEIAKLTCPEDDDVLRIKQLKSLCEITQIVLKTAYHLAQQKKQIQRSPISENN